MQQGQAWNLGTLLGSAHPVHAGTLCHHPAFRGARRGGVRVWWPPSCPPPVPALFAGPDEARGSPASLDGLPHLPSFSSFLISPFLPTPASSPRPLLQARRRGAQGPRNKPLRAPGSGGGTNRQVVSDLGDVSSKTLTRECRPGRGEAWVPQKKAAGARRQGRWQVRAGPGHALGG